MISRVSGPSGQPPRTLTGDEVRNQLLSPILTSLPPFVLKLSSPSLFPPVEKLDGKRSHFPFIYLYLYLKSSLFPQGIKASENQSHGETQTFSLFDTDIVLVVAVVTAFLF